MKALPAIAALAAALAVTGAHAAHAPSHAAEPKAAEVADGYALAEVRRIDKDAGKITLKHGPIANLDMAPMSMVFRARDSAMLDALKEGDKVRFKAEKIQGALTVTEIERVK